MSALIKTASKTVGKLGQTAVPALNLFDQIKDLYKTRTEEKAKRAGIAELAEIRKSELKENANILRDYLTKTFKERRHNFDKFFQLLEDGLDENNRDKIDEASAQIKLLVLNSPLKQALEIVNKVNNRQTGEIIDI